MNKNHVLGEGYIWFSRSSLYKCRNGYDGLHLVTKASGIDPVELKIDRDNLGSWQKVRLVAVLLPDRKKVCKARKGKKT